MLDSHCHLTDERLDAAAVIAAMAPAGLESLVTVGYDMPSSRRCVEIAAQNSKVYATVGLQPGELKGVVDSDLEELLTLSAHPKTVAIGEMGLDYFYDDVDRQTQRIWLQKQLELTAATKLPAVFHLRDAYEDMEKIISSSLNKLPSRGVMHCFSGSKETALRYVDLGFYISFSGSITFKNAVKFAEIVRALPAESILAETDSPYLAPVPLRGQTNYPQNVRLVVAKIAEYRGIDFEEAEALTTANARRLFAKMR